MALSTSLACLSVTKPRCPNFPAQVVRPLGRRRFPEVVRMTTPDDKAAREIRATIDELLDAYLTRDLDRFVSYFTDDIVAMPSGMPPVVGIEAWRELLTRFFAGSDVTNVVSRSEDITVVGDWAIEWHDEAATYTPRESGEPERVYNKGMWVFHKEGGRWKIARYIWNDNPQIEPDAWAQAG